MNNDEKKLYLVYFEDSALVPLPVWLTDEQYAECLRVCKKPRKFELIGSLVDGKFQPYYDFMDKPLFSVFESPYKPF